MQDLNFMNNQKISARQVKRTLTLELLGISTLLLPSLVASRSGVDGFFALAVGGGCAWILLIFWQKYFQKTDFYECVDAFVAELRFPIQIFYGTGFLGIAGYTLYLLTSLIENQLLGKNWEVAIVLTLTGAAFFGLLRGLECRVRVYEVLYFFLLIPLLVILGLACAGIDPDAWTPVATSSVSNFLQSSYLSFLFFSGISLYTLFQPSCKNPKAAYRGTKHALLVVLGLNMAIYLILLGVFRSELLAHLDWPVIDLMAVVKLPGNFLERQDALMVGIWFFCLFAFLDSMLFYAVEFWMKLFQIKSEMCVPNTKSERKIQKETSTHNREDKQNESCNQTGECNQNGGKVQDSTQKTGKQQKCKLVVTGILTVTVLVLALLLLHYETLAERIFSSYLYGILPVMLFLPLLLGIGHRKAGY